MRPIPPDNGSVALEYALAVFLIAVPVFLFWFCLFNPVEGYSTGASITFNGEEISAGGKAFAAFFQRMLSGVALPVP